MIRRWDNTEDRRTGYYYISHIQRPRSITIYSEKSTNTIQVEGRIYLNTMRHEDEVRFSIYYQYNNFNEFKLSLEQNKNKQYDNSIIRINNKNIIEFASKVKQISKKFNDKTLQIVEVELGDEFILTPSSREYIRFISSLSENHRMQAKI